MGKVKLMPAQNPENGHTTKKPTAKLRIASNQITFANPPQDQNKPIIVKTAVPAAGTANPQANGSVSAAKPMKLKANMIQFNNTQPLQ